MKRVVVLGLTSVGLMVVNACANVAGLTGYEFVDGGDGDGEVTSDGAPGSDGATPHDGAVADAKADAGDSAVCMLAPASGSGGSLSLSGPCATCVTTNCCDQANTCSATAECPKDYKDGTCLAGTAFVPCSSLKSCVALHCMSECK